MSIYFGNQKIAEIYHGNVKIKEVYKGSSLVYQSQSELILFEENKVNLFKIESQGNGIVNITSNRIELLGGDLLTAVTSINKYNLSDYSELVITCEHNRNNGIYVGLSIPPSRYVLGYITDGTLGTYIIDISGESRTGYFWVSNRNPESATNSYIYKISLR